MRISHLAVAVAIAAAAVSSCGPGSEPEPDDEASWQAGLALTGWGPDVFATPESDAALFSLARTGASDVAIVPTWFMDHPGSDEVAPDAERTPSDAGVRSAAKVAGSLGLDVTIKPHVDVLDGTFRGEIAPASPEAWFASYRRMLNHYAELAEEVDATMLVIATELESLSSHEEEFRRLIAAARDRFSGTLTYAANWVDEAERVGFWDALDLIGVDAYMPLHTESDHPSVEELAAAWGTYRDRLAALRERVGKPVLFTELGYESRVGTTLRPYGLDTGEVSQEAQDRAYEAAFRVWSEVEWFRGIYWWDWPAADEPADVAAGSYTPRDKLAEATLTEWQGRLSDAR